MEARKRGKLSKAAVAAVGLVGLVITIVFSCKCLLLKRQIIQGMQKADVETERAVEEINKRLSMAMESVDPIAERLSSGKLDYGDVPPELEKSTGKDPDIYGIGAAFAPYAYDPNTRLFGPYYTREGGAFKYSRIDALYDYTSSEYDWYHVPMAEGSQWLEPLYGKASRSLVALYASVFYKSGTETRKDRNANGVVIVTITLDKMHSIVRSLKLGGGGFGFILSRKGIFISHPNEQYVKDLRNIADVAKETSDDMLQLAARKAQEGNHAVINSVNKITGQPIWIFCEPIPKAGWMFCAVVLKENFIPGIYHEKGQKIWLAFGLLLFLLSLIDLFLGRRVMSLLHGGHHRGPAPDVKGRARAVRRLVMIVLALFSITSAVISAFLIRNQVRYRRDLVEKAKKDAVDATVLATRVIDTLVKKAMNLVDGIADDLTSGKLKKENAMDRVKKMINDNLEFYGSTVSFAPYRYDPARRLFGPYYYKKNGKTLLEQVEDSYDYTTTEYEWYSKTVKVGPIWSEPYFDEAGGTRMITYSSPFYGIDPNTNKKEPFGVVTVDVEVDEIAKIVSDLNLGNNGYGALTTKTGHYLYHPEDEYVKLRKTIFDVAREKNDKDRLFVGEEARKGKNGILEHISATTGLKSWLIYEPIPSTGWSLQTTFPLDGIRIDRTALRRRLMKINISLVLSCILFAGLILIPLTSGHQGWELSIAITLAFAAGIIYAWNLYLQNHPHETTNSKITDIASRKNFERDYDALSKEQNFTEPIYIPTGFFIQTAEFLSSNNVNVTGYIWQKYAIGVHDNLQRGFIFPESVKMQTLEEKYRGVKNGEELIVWSFSCTLRENFNFLDYPLDKNSIWIRAVHAQLGDNIILVPDLESYMILSPLALPGIEKDFVLPGLTAYATYFSIKKNSYNTNFGFSGANTGAANSPEMYFNISIRRNIMDALISSITPLIVVAFLLFGRLFAVSSNPKRTEDRKWVEYSAGFLVFVASLFFVTILAHINLRGKFAAQELMYIEFFYVITYIMMLGCTMSALVFYLRENVRVIAWRDNHISRLLYWPVLFLMLYVVTMTRFY